MEGETRGTNPWKLMFLALLIAGVLALAGWVLLESRLLVVRDIAVVGVDRVAARDIRAAVGVTTGTPLARVDTGTAARRVEELRLVEAAEVRRQWPATVRVEVTERTPELSVRVGDGYRLVDHDGVRIDDVEDRPEEYPRVTVTGEISGNPAIAAAAEVADAFPNVSRLEHIDATDREAIVLRLAGGGGVVWGEAEQARRKGRLLEVLLRRHPPEDGRRYDVSAAEVAVVR